MAQPASCRWPRPPSASSKSWDTVALVLRKSVFAKLPADVLTIDFSGWPIFVHAELPEKRVTQICAALEARKHLIPWQGDGPLPVERMCRDSPESPVNVPFHPAAQAFWQERGICPE